MCPHYVTLIYSSLQTTLYSHPQIIDVHNKDVLITRMLCFTLMTKKYQHCNKVFGNEPHNDTSYALVIIIQLVVLHFLAIFYFGMI